MIRFGKEVFKIAAFIGVLFWFSIPAFSQAHSIGLRMALKQPGCPLEIQSAKSTTEFMFEEIKVKNISSKIVVEITFGIAYHHITTADEIILPVQTKSNPIHIDPGQEGTIQAFMVSAKEAKEESEKHIEGKLEAELGITKVEFEDGEQYLYDPVPSMKFDDLLSGNPTQGSTSCVPCHNGITNDPANLVTPLAYFTCEGKANQCTICSNNYTSCTMSECLFNQMGCIWSQCPQQQCKYQP